MDVASLLLSSYYCGCGCGCVVVGRDTTGTEGCIQFPFLIQDCSFPQPFSLQQLYRLANCSMPDQMPIFVLWFKIEKMIVLGAARREELERWKGDIMILYIIIYIYLYLSGVYPISCGFKTFFAAKIPYWLGSSTTTQVARIKSTKPVKRPHHKANGEPSPAASAGLPSNNPTSIGVSVGSLAGSLDVDWDFEPTKTATTTAKVIGQEDPSKRSSKILLDPTWKREPIDTVLLPPIE